MEVMNLANGQVGICHYETRSCFSSSYSWNPYTSCGFSISRRPIMGVSSNTKRVRTFGLRIRALSKGESGNSSVGGGIIEKEFEFKPSFNDYLKAMEFVKTGKEKKQAHELNGHNLEHQPKENSMKTLGRDESGVKLRRFGGSMDREKIEEEDRGGVTVRENEVNAELDYREKKNGNSNVKTGGKEIRADANVNTKLIGARVDGRRLSIRTTSMKSNLESFNFGKGVRSSNVAESSAAFDDIISRASAVGTRKRFSHGKDTPQVFEGKGRAFQMEESGSRGNRMNDKLVSHPSQVDKRSLRRNSQNYENSDNNSLEVERAAFKNIEGLDEVICKPHTAKREMEERIQKLAKWLNGADIDMPEWMFSKSMRSAKIRYTDHSILRIVQLLGKLGNWRRVLQLIEWLQMRERYKSNRLRNVYTTALNVLGKARRPVEALNVFRVMQQQTSTYPDIIAYRCIAVTLGQAGHMKELFDVIDSMRSPPKKKSKLEELKKWDPRLEPDIVVYHAVLNACVQRKQWEGAFWVLQQLKLQGQQPSTSTYGLIMEVMLACGKYNLVHEFFRKVKRSSSNALVYRVLVNTLWREGKTDEAVLAVQDMERRGIVGSAALYYDLARCLISAGRCQEALLQIEKICKVANKPLVVTYTGLIQACLDAGNIQNAVFVFNQMKHFCSPNLVTCNIMLKAYIDHGLYEKASELFNNMLEDGKKICSTSDQEVRVFPDIYTFNTMLDACIAEKRWDDFERIYRRMLHHGYHFNEKRHLRMILDASRAGKGELLEITRKHLYLTDRSVPPSLMKERFCVMLERDDIDAALACIVTNSAGESQAYSKTAWSKLFGENGLRFRKDTLIRLMDEVSMLVAKSDAPNQVLESLSASCKAFLRNQGQVKLVHETNTTDFVCSVQTETTLTS